jgi:hypothetical protein
LGLAGVAEGEEFLRAGLDVADEDARAHLLPQDFGDGDAVADGVEQLAENVFKVGDGGHNLAGKGSVALVLGGRRHSDDLALAAQHAVLAGFERGADLAVLFLQVAVEREGGGAVGQHLPPGGGGIVGAAEGDGVGADAGENVSGNQLFGEGLLGECLWFGHRLWFGGPPSLKLRRASPVASAGACVRLDVVSSREWCNKGWEGVSKVSAVFAVVFLCEGVFRAKK